MPFWADNEEAWFCYAEAETRDHGVTYSRVQFLAVVRSLLRELNRYVTPFISSPDCLGPYEQLKKSILKRGDLSDRQRLDESFHTIELGSGLKTEMLSSMKEVIGQRTFDEGLFRQLFLSKLPQQVQAVLVTFNNNPVDELASSVDRILEITRTRHNEVYSVTEKPLETENKITKLCNTLSCFLDLHEQRRPSNPRRRSLSSKRSSLRPRRRENPHWCWYHNTYGKDSKKCRDPCCFSSHKLTVDASGNYPAGTR
uniref:Gag protein n=1 Tax=Schistosoma japonicum TaxID=6182 RepID=C7C1Y7_SCHJA|nr:Gag protein [Schistosoma japonicum]